jgi:hypothetical protein
MLDRAQGSKGAEAIDLQGEDGTRVKWFVGVGVVDVVDGKGHTQEQEQNEDVEGMGKKECVRLLEFTKHIFVDSTGDGGLATSLLHIDGKKLPLWKEYPVEGVQGGDWSLSGRGKEEDGGDGEEEINEAAIRAACHCNAIDFKITREGNEGKFKGKHCACTSCRLATSTPISSWFRVPSTSITSSDPTHTLFPSSLSTNPHLKTYVSSPGASRSFCAICGASVGVEYESEPGVVCVNAGLVRRRRCRIEEVVEWDGEVGGLEDLRAWNVDMGEGVVGMLE